LGLPVIPKTTTTPNGWHSAICKAPDVEQWVQVDLGQPMLLQEVRLVPAHPPDFPERPGFGFPLRFKVEASDNADCSNPRLIFDGTASDFQHPGDNPMLLPAHGVTGRYVRVTATKLFERTSDFVFALSELEVYSNGKNVALRQPVSAPANTLATRWNPEFLTDGLAGGGELVDWESWLKQLSDRRGLADSLDEIHHRQAQALILAQQRALKAGVWMAGLLVAFILYAWGRARLARRHELEHLRDRIARDLHDEIGSHLGSIKLMSELALRDATGQDRESLEEIHRLAQEAAGSMRGIIWLVREPGEPTLGKLIEAMKQSAASLLAQVSWEMDAQGLDLSRKAPLDFHRHVFLFFREAAHNAVRHAAPKQVTVKITQSAGDFVLAIADDGRGFSSQTVSPGSGLANLRHRADALRGRVEIHSEEGGGTRVTLHAPLS
jgi:signal transduction histidine kinase